MPGPLSLADVAARLQKHDSTCEAGQRFDAICTCDYAERRDNTLTILWAVRAIERKQCEDIAREVGNARIADRIRERRLSD